ncbi:DUF488 family protein [Candidatus Poriferisocius sp.]|uniref:DUF488 domain-containing protein n=1 Tax=Candidatus Poriferisocius sp. TaxID=3101276 RepID=UPI003B011502
MSKLSIFTIGYESRRSEEVMDQLARSGVVCLLDVRLRPLSRKPGLSKTVFAESCNLLGIEYIHDKRLGTPPEMLKAVRENGGYEDWDEYRQYLEAQTDALDSALGIVDLGPTALMCFELNPDECHRSVVAEYLHRASGMPVVHL